MLLYLAAALVVCMTSYSSAQYYSNQPQRGYPAPQQRQQQQQQGQRNSEAWRRWYYQQRQQQQQQPAYSSPRGRQPAPLSSPAANSQSNYYNQRQPGGYAAPSPTQYSQQYYQQRPQAPAGYNQQQGYAQPQPYSNYQQPNYRPPPPPATPVPPTTPAELQSAFGARSATDVLNGLIDLVSSAVQSIPVLARQTNLINRGRLTPAVRQATNFRHASLPGSQANMLVQQAQPDLKLLAVLGQKAGNNVGIGTSPGMRNVVQLLSRYTQSRTNPYSYPGDISSALRRVPNRANLQYAYSTRRMFPVNTRNGLAFRQQLIAVKTTPSPKSAPTTTPGVVVATEPLEFEGPTTTPFPRFKQVAAVNLFQARMAGRGGPAPVRQPAAAPVQTPVAPPVRQPVFAPVRQPVSQPLDYPSQPYQSSNANAPPGFISIDAFRNDIMSAIQILTNEIATMATGSNVTSTTTPSTKISKEQQLELIKSKKLAALPGGISFLLGKFASKLPSKMSFGNKLQGQVSQNPPGQWQPPLKKSVPPSEWSGVFDLTPQQQQEFKKGTWSRQWPPLMQTPPPQLQQHHMPPTTPPNPQTNQILDPQVPPPHQQHQPPHQQHQPPHQQHQPPPDPMLPSHGQNPPPEQLMGPTTAAYPQQTNQSYLFEQQQPPLFDLQQQGSPNMPMEPHPLDLPGQQPWQQSPPPGYQQTSNFQGSKQTSYQQQPGYQQPSNFHGSRQTSYQQPPPQDFAPAPLAPMWREPPPPPTQPPPTHVHSQSQQNQYEPAPLPPEMNLNQGQKHPPPQQPQPLDTPLQQQPGPQEYPPQQQQQQPAPQEYPHQQQQQQPAPQEYPRQQQQQQPAPQEYPRQQQQQQPAPQEYPNQQQQQQPGPQEYPHQQQQQQQQQQQPLDLQWSQQQQHPPPVQDIPPSSNNPPMINSFEQFPQSNPGQNTGTSQYSNQYQPGQSGSYQQGQYQQPAPQSQPSGYSSNYYQPAPQQQPAQPQQQQPQPTQPQPSQPQPLPQQQQYAQSGWSQPPQQSSYGAQSPQPAADPTDPFSTKFDMNALKPTVFNSQYQNQPPQQGPSPQTGGGEFAGLFGEQVTQRQNPNAPPGKADFISKGPNPIQLNQFMAQPTSPKDANALDVLLGSLLSGTVAAQNSQQASFRPIPNTTTKAPPPVPASSLVSDRLNGFVLGPRSEYRSNMFSEIPVNNAGYDNLNPLAGFMGETPPPPVTTTPVPPGRNGDFLEGFIGVNKAFEPPKPARDNYQPNIYVYNPMNDAAPPARTPPPPRPRPPPMATNDQALNNMGTQELTSMVERLLGVLSSKQGGVGQG